MGSIGASNDVEVDVLIIGGGFGGVYAMHKVREMGLSMKLIEAGSYFGGTWHWNQYPGCRVDSEMPYYQLSILEVWKTWNFSERFPGYKEIRRYFAHCDKVLDLSKDCFFSTVVTEAKYDGSQWLLKTNSGWNAKCKYLILATGSTYKKHYPDFKNMDKYRGTLIHSAMYPNEGLDVKGKRIAIVGSGATGVQLVQEIAKEDCHLTAYIRTPNTAFPMHQRRLTVEEQEANKSCYEAYFKIARKTRLGFPYNVTSKSLWDVSEEERLAKMEECWSRGGFAFLASSYRDFMVDRKANAVYYDFWAKKVRERIKNPQKRDIMAPLKQDIIFGCKRPSLEQDYYECIDRDNVELVNLRETGLREFSEKGIITDDNKEREFDIVILATGYDFLTGSLIDLNIQDTKGRNIQQKWKEGVYTYLGLTVQDMPNMFMVYSPQAPTSLSNGPPIIEVQVDWIVDAIKKMRDEGIESLNPKFEATEKWRSDIQDMNEKTLYPLENSWYMGANIPGKKREQLLYLGGVEMYEGVIREALDGWKGFDVLRSGDNEAVKS